ncbi:hypothetical protein BGZ75_010057 [Mortierella antarctica]|nr:hypothetical protein BGZ75_010057 [Mortierella antarctica]
MNASCKRAARFVQTHGVVPYVTPLFMEVIDSDSDHAVMHTSPVAQLQGSFLTMTISSSQQDIPAVPPSPPAASPASSSAARPLSPPQTEDLVTPAGNKTDNFAGPSTVRHSRADQL